MTLKLYENSVEFYQPDEGIRHRFGDVEIVEDTSTEHLSTSERNTYLTGFKKLEDLVERANPGDRVKLVESKVVSMVVGYQPLIMGYSKEQFEILTESLSPDEYYFFASRREKDPQSTFSGMYDLVGINIAAARATLGVAPEVTNDQFLLGLKSELAKSGRNTDYLYGVLSGYPFEDAYWYSYKRPLYRPGKFFENYISPTDFFKADVPKSAILLSSSWSRPDGFIEGNISKIKQFTTNGQSKESKAVSMLGMRWATTDPPSEAAMEKCQKMLEMDRMLELTKYVRSIDMLSV